MTNIVEAVSGETCNDTTCKNCKQMKESPNVTFKPIECRGRWYLDIWVNGLPINSTVNFIERTAGTICRCSYVSVISPDDTASVEQMGFCTFTKKEAEHICDFLNQESEKGRIR